MTSTSFFNQGTPSTGVVTQVYTGTPVFRDREFLGISAWYAPWNSTFNTLPDTSLYSLNRYCFVANNTNMRTSWGIINHANGVYDWTEMDTWVNYHNGRGTQILYSLGSPCPFWATPAATQVFTDTSTNPSRQWCRDYPSMAVFAAWVTAVGTRYSGKITHWFVANEPDLASGEYIGTTPQLAEMTRVASQILKSINPANKIVGPELSNISYTKVGPGGYLPTFLSASAAGYDAGFGTGAGTQAKDWLDYVTFHPYTNQYTLPTDPYVNVIPNSADNQTNYARFKALLTSLNITVPIWASEIMMISTGPTTGSPTWTWEREYAFLFRSAIIAAVMGCEKFTWFSTGGSNKPYLRSDIPEATQARTALAQLISILGSGITEVAIMSDASMRVTCGLGDIYV